MNFIATLRPLAVGKVIAAQDNQIWSVLQQNPWIAIYLLLVILLVVAGVAIVSEYRRRMMMSNSLDTDVLTGLATQHKLMKDTQRLLADNPQEEYCLISIDIDNFKYINEMYGYATGSKLLRIVAEYLGRNITEKTLLARCGADQFLVTVPTAVAKKAVAEWETLDEHLQEQIVDVVGISCRVSFSLGIYEIKDRTLDIHVMVDYAGIARGRGKDATGFTCYYFTDQMAHARAISNEITTAMVPAIRNEEFVLYYQPKVDMYTQKFVGAEVLVRWLRDDQLIPPMNFIPLFEKNGFIETLDYYVLGHACYFISKNQDLALPRISVNLSSVTMLQPNVVANVVNIVSRNEISPTQLDLEITETALVENSVVLERLSELRSHGFTISMDDFGTGVSSLNRLKNMQLDTLKIDREFIIDAIENPRGNKILHHVVQMAKDLKLDTVAEGIETAEQLAFLQEIGCDYGQGFFFARPMAEERFVQYCEKQITAE